LIYERTDDPALFIEVDIDETGRYVWFNTNKAQSNKNELFVKDLGNPLTPNMDAPVRALYPGHTARRTSPSASSTVRSISRQTSTRQRGRSSRRPIDRPRGRQLEDDSLRPDRTRSNRRAWFARAIAVTRLVDVASEVRFVHLDGTDAGTTAHGRASHRRGAVRPV